MRIELLFWKKELEGNSNKRLPTRSRTVSLCVVIHMCASLSEGAVLADSSSVVPGSGIRSESLKRSVAPRLNVCIVLNNQRLSIRSEHEA